jgi:hypothetical protein
MWVTTGVPFSLMVGQAQPAVGRGGKVKNSPIGRGFRGMNGENEAGEALLDITFEDTEAVTDLPGGAELKGRSVRWVRKDFTGKELEIVMRNNEGEPQWGLRLRIRKDGRVPKKTAGGGNDLTPEDKSAVNGRGESVEEKMGTLIRHLDGMNRTLLEMEQRLRPPARPRADQP